MASRRVFLASAVGLGGSLCGCLTESGLAKTGYLQFKIVVVEWNYDGDRYHDNILRGSYDGENRPRCRIAEEYQGLVNAVDDIRVTDELADCLESTFTDVRYVLGFCWADGECRNPTVGRGEFNRVQFGDRAEIIFDHPGVHIVDVYENANATLDEWEDIRTVDFSTYQAQNGVPIA